MSPSICKLCRRVEQCREAADEGRSHYIFASSTRRFFARPSSVVLTETGLLAPNPLATSRDEATPCEVSQATTACARFSESV